jgi:uncharacterized cupredoxin-like copper-binding protein
LRDDNAFNAVRCARTRAGGRRGGRASFNAGLILFASCLSACRKPPPAWPELRITAEEHAFRMTDSVPAGLVRIVLHNAGTDIHEAMLARFTDTIGTAAKYVDSVRAKVDFPSNAEDVGGAALTMPGDSSSVWLNLVPGHYVVLCWAGDHLSHGMAHDLWVVASKDPPVPPPTSTRQLTLLDFAFKFDAPLTAGTYVLHVRNNGTEPHEGDMIKETPTAGLREYMAWLDAGSHGLPPVAPISGFGDFYPGKEAWVELHLTPGRYFIICGVNAKSDGRPHYKHGMITEFTIR